MFTVQTENLPEISEVNPNTSFYLNVEKGKNVVCAHYLILVKVSVASVTLAPQQVPNTGTLNGSSQLIY